MCQRNFAKPKVKANFSFVGTDREKIQYLQCQNWYVHSPSRKAVNNYLVWLIFSELFQSFSLLESRSLWSGRGNPENKYLEIQLGTAVMTKKSFIILTINACKCWSKSSIQDQPNDCDYSSSSHQSRLWRRLIGLGLNLSWSWQSCVQYASRGTGRALAFLGASSLWLGESLRGLPGLLLVDGKYWFLSMGQKLSDL